MHGQGLSSSEAELRLKRYGKNELAKEDPPSFWELLFEQFTDILVLMLMAAAIGIAQAAIRQLECSALTVAMHMRMPGARAQFRRVLENTPQAHLSLSLSLRMPSWASIR